MASTDTPFWYPRDFLRYQVTPPVFVVFFTAVVQFLAIKGRSEEFTLALAWEYSKGNCSSWMWVIFIIAWATVSLKLPSKIVYGPETPFGYRPPYKDNGFWYYCFTLAFFLVGQLMYPNLSLSIYDNFPQILGSLNIVALVLCLLLLIKGKNSPDHPEDPIECRPVLYEFYRGIELHPRAFGIEIKQLTNCRIGLMGWQIFICSFYFAGLQAHGFNTASLVNLILQTVYLAKFFWWEAGYFYTLDMMLDRAGYYLCWGCLEWVSCLYTYSSYYIVAHPPSMSSASTWIIFLLGILSTAFNYQVDYEKQKFRNSPNFNCKIWGKKAQYIMAEYQGPNKELKKTALLTTGFWGIGRHINYTFELTAAFCWCAAGGFDQYLWPFLYFIFLTGLLVHRTIRDEEKCAQKYTKAWTKYCKAVPYRLIPYLW